MEYKTTVPLLHRSTRSLWSFCISSCIAYCILVVVLSLFVVWLTFSLVKYSNVQCSMEKMHTWDTDQVFSIIKSKIILYCPVSAQSMGCDRQIYCQVNRSLLLFSAPSSSSFSLPPLSLSPSVSQGLVIIDHTAQCVAFGCSAFQGATVHMILRLFVKNFDTYYIFSLTGTQPPQTGVYLFINT